MDASGWTLVACVAVAAVLGGTAGWLLRGVRSRGELATERARLLDDDGVERMRFRLASLEGVREERDRLRSEVVTAQRSASNAADAVAEAMLFGSTSSESGRVDDLTLVKGIGPKIAELCHDGGILTWADMARVDPATLSGLLERGGSRYQFHDPSTWPEQAALLSEGRWDDFNELLARMDRQS